MNLRILLLTLAISIASLAASAETLLNLEGEEASSIGIYIKDLRTGKVLAEQNPLTALTPASVTKAITTATALSICGADTCFVTKVGLSGEISGSTCTGNLVVRSVADPTIESENFLQYKGFCEKIVAALKRRGISKITGSIVVEQTLSDAGPVWQWEIEDVAWAYGAALHGFNYRDNIVTVIPATGKITPEVPGLELKVIKSKDGDIVRGVGSNKLTIYTRDPNDKKYGIKVTVPDPSAVFICQMRKTLAEAGITMGKKAVDSNSFSTIYTHRSPCYGDIMHSLMVRSDNMFAEGMLRTIAPGTSRKDALKRQRALWDQRGISTKLTTIRDGSGLARSNALSPRFIADVLEWMAKSSMAETYTSFFPRAAKEGTMRGFLEESPLEGKIALKTGAVGGVQCYAGYKLDDDDNPTHVIVVMVNKFFCPRRDVRKATEALLERLFINE